MPIRKNILPIYPALETKITERGIKKKDIADTLGITARTLSSKLTNKVSFTLDEALAIKRNFFDDVNVETLFQKK